MLTLHRIVKIDTLAHCQGCFRVFCTQHEQLLVCAAILCQVSIADCARSVGVEMERYAENSSVQDSQCMRGI
jgi:hypothetical protein